jgi:hypothetical protein
MLMDAQHVVLRHIVAEEKGMGKNQYVSPHPNGWQVKGEGNKKPSAVKTTQKEAISNARVKAINQGSELIVKGRNGRIRHKDSFGNDPFPPKG